MDYRDTMAWQRIATWFVQTDSAGSVLLIPANPQRVGLILSADSAQQQYFTPSPIDVLQPSGIILTQATGPLVLDHAHHGALVQSAWFVWCPVLGEFSTAVELVMDTPPTPFQTTQRRNHAESGMPLHDAT